MAKARKANDGWDEDLLRVRQAGKALPALFTAAANIDALDDVARGFKDPDDRRRVEGSRKALAKGLASVIPDIEHCVRLATSSAGGPDPEWGVFFLVGCFGDLASTLSALSRRVNAKLGKMPSRARVAAGARAWKMRDRADRALLATAAEREAA